jgi:Domain of unknown function (DUF4371)
VPKQTACHCCLYQQKNGDTFISKGFSNRKKAIQKFSDHEKSACRQHACQQLRQVKASPIDAQISKQKESEQASARLCILKVIETVRFLARQGLALRGHNAENSNMMQLLQLRSQDLPCISAWVKKTTNFTSPESQNEILTMLSHGIYNIS